MWLKIYIISCCMAIALFAKMQYYGESFYSEDSTVARSNIHSHSSGGSGGSSHRTYHK